MVLSLGASEITNAGANVGFVTNNVARAVTVPIVLSRIGTSAPQLRPSYLSTTAIASISTMKSGCDRRRTSTCRAVWQRLTEDLVTDLGMLEELIDVGHVGRRLHQILQADTGGLERDAQVLPDLADLLGHVSGADDAS